MKFDLKKITFYIDNKLFYFNFNFFKEESKELSYIFKKNILKDCFYFKDLVFKKNRLISAKISNNKAIKVKINEITITNNYYKKTIILKSENLMDYHITHLNHNTNNFLSRKFYDKMTLLEIFDYQIKEPLYMVQKINLNLINIFSEFTFNYQKDIIYIEKKEEILKLNINGNYENFLFFFDKNKSENFLKYQQELFKVKINLIIVQLNNYLNNLNISSYTEIEYHKEKLSKNGYLIICGFSIINNNLFLTKFLTISDVIKYQNKKILLNKKYYDFILNNIDNNNITFHKNKIKSFKMLNFKKNIIEEKIKYLKNLKNNL